MKILLINNNPVVSRLTALSARKEDIEIDEIQEVTELSSDTYDIVFVDADSWTKDVRDVISENIKTQKSVLFYGDGDEEEKASFDLSILKPFLPSEVSAVIRSLEEETKVLEDDSNSEVKHFDIIKDAEVSKRDELFDLDETDTFEEKKIEALVTKTEEIKETKTTINSDNNVLEESLPVDLNALEDDLFDNNSKVNLDLAKEIELKEPEKKELLEKSKEDISNELFDLDLSDELPSLEDNLFSETKKEEVLDSLPSLEFDTLSLDEEVKKEETPLEKEPVLVDIPKKETKILDQSEIENIKGLLSEDVSNEMTLEELMTPIATPALEEKPKEPLLPNTSAEIEQSVLVQTLTNMSIYGLRELLAGSKVNIKIKFPKSK